MGDLSDRIKAIEYGNPDYIPISVNILPSAWKKHREDMEKIVLSFPAIFRDYKKGSRDFDLIHGTYQEGDHVDVWGCIWQNIQEGNESIVTNHPVPARKDVHSLKIPEENAGLPHGFMYLRLADLRGFEEIMVDFAEEPPELQKLIDIVLEYNLKQAEFTLNNSRENKIIYMGDDLGLQKNLPISPQKWRKYLKPCYKEIFKVFRDAGKYVYLHTDGHIIPVIRDLIDCGANVINPQFRANGLENLVKECRGKVCIDLDLDRQMFPFCKPEDVEPHIREVVEALGMPKGGLWLFAEIGPDCPLKNVEAICLALEKYKTFFS